MCTFFMCVCGEEGLFGGLDRGTGKREEITERERESERGRERDKEVGRLVNGMKDIYCRS